MLGFLYFAAGEKEKALAQVEKIAKLDTAGQKLESDGDWSDSSRLKWGIDHGFLYAFPNELKAYDPRQRLAVLLADFYYVNQKFDEAAEMSQRLSQNEFGHLGAEALSTRSTCMQPASIGREVAPKHWRST